MGESAELVASVCFTGWFLSRCVHNSVQKQELWRFRLVLFAWSLRAMVAWTTDNDCNLL